MSKAVDFILPLPMAIDQAGSVEPTKKLMRQMRDHLFILERQVLFFSLSQFLANIFPEVQSFKFKMGSHYNDEGYSDHVNLSVTIKRDDGSLATFHADKESGDFECQDEDDGDEEDGLSIEKYNKLSNFVGDFKTEILAQLQEETIDATSVRALAQSVMGEQGFALYELCLLDAQAKEGKCSDSAQRL
jgi:hypothetical protein